MLIMVLAVMNVVRSEGPPGQEFPSQGGTHIDEINVEYLPYNSTPPTSGWHVGRIADWGSCDFVVPDELLVHNMEDGGVILWYQLGTPEENRAHINRLKESARGYDRVVIAPREDLETTYAMTAWQQLGQLAPVPFTVSPSPTCYSRVTRGVAARLWVLGIVNTVTLSLGTPQKRRDLKRS